MPLGGYRGEATRITSTAAVFHGTEGLTS